MPERAVVVGLGIEGIALARFLSGRGARVTVTDAKPVEALSAHLAELDGVPVAYRLGGTDPALAEEADALYVSQSVPLSLPLVRAARERGMTVRSIVTLVFDTFRGRIAAVTGSSGKTTTTSLVDAMFTAAGVPHILAGNIGRWPLGALADAGPDEWAVLEISHTQLQLLERSPHIGCVTNVTPNHLDQFDWDAYTALKRNLIRHQAPNDIAVLNLDNEVTRAFAGDTAARVLFFSMSGNVPADGVFLRDETVVWRQGAHETNVIDANEIPLRGRHNIENVLAATGVAAAAGLSMEAVARAVRAFHAVPHRLEKVAEIGGVAWYNDSIATAPERTLAGMRSFHEPLVLLLGGRDKNLPLDELAAECAARCRAVVTFGEAGDLFATAVRHAASALAVIRVDSLNAAVEQAARLAQPGDIVLLSPAGTSFDAFPNFERRGEAFRALVAGRAEGRGNREEGRGGTEAAPSPGPSPTPWERGDESREDTSSQGSGGTQGSMPESARDPRAGTPLPHFVREGGRGEGAGPTPNDSLPPPTPDSRLPTPASAPEAHS
jgi:UDP-N-acetylmuramoylalanine--D-glutamate ligase